MVYGPYIAWNLELSFPGTNEPWTFRSSDHLFTGTFIPNYKKVVKLVFSAIPGLAVPKLMFISYGYSYFYFCQVFYSRCDFHFRSGF